jgi:hypothetical protein
MTEGERKRLIESLVAAEYKIGKVDTQEGACAMAARLDLTMQGPPADEHELFMRCAATAEGFFGPAWAVADYGQRSGWIDMVERGMRAALLPDVNLRRVARDAE